ncbi:MAG: hypothetical protein JRH20_31405 [Deltaproteobacteria bacterium]|nr:hypothetical protein [Deltaproteobacteria bacterium]
MDKRKVLSPDQIRELLDEAARERLPQTEAGLTLEDLEAAAAEVGIDGAKLREAAARMERRSGVKLTLLFVGITAAIIATALLVLPARMVRGWRHGTLSVHNEQRHQGTTVELWAPLADTSANCETAPRGRVPASSYCLARRVHLEPRQRVRLEIPQRPQACPQIWVRTRSPGRTTRSALFTLPAAVEIDRHGRLDQKGMGHPHMHAPPDGSPTLIDCPKTDKPGGHA